MKCQIPLEVSFHRKASTSCAIALPRWPTEKPNLQWQNYDLNLAASLNEISHYCLHCHPNVSNLYFPSVHVCVSVSHVCVFVCTLFFFLWLRYRICCIKDSLFPVVRQETDRGHTPVQKKC